MLSLKNAIIQEFYKSGLLSNQGKVYYGSNNTKFYWSSMLGAYVWWKRKLLNLSILLTVNFLVCVLLLCVWHTAVLFLWNCALWFVLYFCTSFLYWRIIYVKQNINMFNQKTCEIMSKWFGTNSQCCCFRSVLKHVRYTTVLRGW